jgi:magnesium transporter
METDVDAIEEETFSPGRRTDIEPIYLLKREVVELRRAVWPLTDALARMQTDYQDLLPKEIRRYMRDVADHQTLAADLIASHDEMLTSLVHAALARVELQQNLDVRKISAWVAIAAVPTMIAVRGSRASAETTPAAADQARRRDRRPTPDAGPRHL